MTTTGTSLRGAIGHYNLLERLEPAGPGERYRARDTRLGRTVDIRVLPPDFAPAEGDRAAVLDEAAHVRALSHPNIVALFDAGVQQGRIYFAFELPRAVPLRREMAGRPLAPRRALEIGVQVADALAEAHGQDLVHGALGVDSILITDKDQVKVAGIGLPALRAYDARHVAAGLQRPADPSSTRWQHDGAGAGDRSDIYALGAVLYELIAGRRPVPAGASSRPTVPRLLNPASSPEVDDVILRALAASPDARFQTAAVMGAELRSVLAMLAVREREPVMARTAGIRLGRMLLMSLLVLAAIVAIAWWLALS